LPLTFPIGIAFLGVAPSPLLGCLSVIFTSYFGDLLVSADLWGNRLTSMRSSRRAPHRGLFSVLIVFWFFFCSFFRRFFGLHRLVFFFFQRLRPLVSSVIPLRLPVIRYSTLWCPCISGGLLPCFSDLSVFTVRFGDGCILIFPLLRASPSPFLGENSSHQSFPSLRRKRLLFPLFFLFHTCLIPVLP